MNDAPAELEVTWQRALRVWWSYTWRTLVFSILLGIVLGATAGIALGAMGKAHLARRAGETLGQLGTIPVSLLVMRMVLRKQFKEFSIRLVPRS